MRFLVALGCGAMALCVGSTTAGQSIRENGAASAGVLSVTFLYMPPTEVEPTYHTAMWLEDVAGKLVKTLFVSSELSANEYKNGDACPDWVKQASWQKAPKSLVDA